jgi:hypothetical protein
MYGYTPSMVCMSTSHDLAILGYLKPLHIKGTNKNDNILVIGVEININIEIYKEGFEA